MLADVYHTATFAHVAYTQRAAPHTLQESAHGSPEPTPAARHAHAASRPTAIARAGAAASLWPNPLARRPRQRPLKAGPQQRRKTRPPSRRASRERAEPRPLHTRECGRAASTDAARAPRRPREPPSFVR